MQDSWKHVMNSWEEDDEEYSSQLDKLVEVKGVGVAVSHPALELDQNGRKPPNTPMPHLSANKHNGNNSLVELGESLKSEC